MAEQQPPPGLLISKAIQSERQSSRKVDLGKLEETLAKSSLWKANTLQRIEKARSESQSTSKEDVLQSLKRSLLQLIDQHRQAFVDDANSSDERHLEIKPSEPVGEDDSAARRDMKLQNECAGLRQALADQVKEVTRTRSQLQEREGAIQERSKVIERLRQTISSLQEENTRLRARHKDDLDGEKIRIVDLQQAYDQFQQQSDQLLSELEEENLRLRAGEIRSEEELQLTPIRLNS
jgi:hypothetical protein